MINILGLTAGEWLWDIIRSISFWLDSVIYLFAGTCYRVFMAIGTAQFTDTEFIEKMFTRFTLILGIFMMFRLTISLVQMVIDPELIGNKDKGVGNIIKRICISVVLLAFMPQIFKLAYKLQDEILRNGGQVIANLIIGGETTDMDFSSEFPMRIFNTFFQGYENAGGTEIKDINKIGEYKEYVNEKDSTGNYFVAYNSPLSIIAGIVLCYIFLVYAIQVAIRVGKLFFLQAISPIPVLSYINPGDDKLKKWTKECMNTYLDLFIRLGSVFFVAIFIDKIGELEIDTQYSDIVGIAKVGVYIGLLLFAKKIPDLVKDLLGVQGDYTMHTKEAKKVGSFVGGAVVGGVTGAITGAATGHGWGRLTSGFGGLFKGVGTGAKGSGFTKNMKGIYDSRKAVAQKQLEYKRAGSSVWGRMGARMGLDANAAADNTLAVYQEWSDNQKAIYDIADDKGSVKAAKNKYNVTGDAKDYNIYKAARNKYIAEELGREGSAISKYAKAADDIAKSHSGLEPFKEGKYRSVTDQSSYTYYDWDESKKEFIYDEELSIKNPLSDVSDNIKAASGSIKADKSYRQAQTDQKAAGGKK